MDELDHPASGGALATVCAEAVRRSQTRSHESRLLARRSLNLRVITLLQGLAGRQGLDAVPDAQACLERARGELIETEVETRRIRRRR